MTSRHLVGIALAGAVLATRVEGQTPAGRYIEAARAQIDALHPDSAIALLHTALNPNTGPGVADRLRGYLLLGVAELINQRRSEARAAMREALTLDPEMRIDSLAFLSSDLLSTFNAERASMDRARSLSLLIEAPSDTLVPVDGGGYRVVVLPTRHSLVTLTVTAESGGAALHVDTAVASGITTFDWALRRANGGLIAPGRYHLRLTATDSAGERAAPVLRLLTIGREQVDTTPWPPPIAPEALAPESIKVHERSRPSLLRGLAFGLAGGALAYFGAGPSGVKDGRAFVAGGALAAGGVLGFLTGHVTMAPNPAGIEQNRRLREQDAQNRAAVTESNARAREGARIRIRTSSLSP